jgi:predicted AAA+ superfamily ATPase
VQRAPDLFLAVKRAVDLAPVPGQFILTGSFNLLLKRRFRVARDLTPDR